MATKKVVATLPNTAPAKPFKISEVKNAMKEALRTHLQSEKGYKQDEMAKKCKTIAEEVRKLLRNMNKPRYKIVVQVTIGHNIGQGVRIGAKCLWDSKNDHYVSETFVSENIYAVATAFLVYLY
eukprot:TRINITY_DN6903_c0_g1_i8.p1 TRINITY_DN6903_c0_g1~~TRINITY_DN6903_c0_g1_i8.p1  ORF type:complete len:124 (+),score=40.39 TRINITY_DN6903_c0_g1_i8:46-417(+)